MLTESTCCVCMKDSAWYSSHQQGDSDSAQWGEADRMPLAKVAPIPNIQSQLGEQLFKQTLYLELT